MPRSMTPQALYGPPPEKISDQRQVCAPREACETPTFRRRLLDLGFSPLPSRRSPVGGASVAAQGLREKIERRDLRDVATTGVWEENTWEEGIGWGLPTWESEVCAGARAAKAKTLELRQRTRALFAKADEADLCLEPWPEPAPEPGTVGDAGSVIRSNSYQWKSQSMTPNSGDDGDDIVERDLQPAHPSLSGGRLGDRLRRRKLREQANSVLDMRDTPDEEVEVRSDSAPPSPSYPLRQKAATPRFRRRNVTMLPTRDSTTEDVKTEGDSARSPRSRPTEEAGRRSEAGNASPRLRSKRASPKPSKRRPPFQSRAAPRPRRQDDIKPKNPPRENIFQTHGITLHKSDRVRILFHDGSRVKGAVTILESAMSSHYAVVATFHMGPGLTTNARESVCEVPKYSSESSEAQRGKSTTASPPPTAKPLQQAERKFSMDDFQSICIWGGMECQTRAARFEWLVSLVELRQAREAMVGTDRLPNPAPYQIHFRGYDDDNSQEEVEDSDQKMGRLSSRLHDDLRSFFHKSLASARARTTVPPSLVEFEAADEPSTPRSAIPSTPRPT